MKEHFKEQSNSDKRVPLTEEKLAELKGKSLYGEYKVGDVLFWFLEQELGNADPPYTEPSITLTLRSVVEKDFDRLAEDFNFIRIAGEMFPVLERKKNE